MAVGGIGNVSGRTGSPAQEGVGPSPPSALRRAMPSATNSRSTSLMQTSPAPRRPTLPHSRSVPQQVCSHSGHRNRRPIPLPSPTQFPDRDPRKLRPKPETPPPSPSPPKPESRSPLSRQAIPLPSRRRSLLLESMSRLLRPRRRTLQPLGSLFLPLRSALLLPPPRRRIRRASNSPIGSVCRLIWAHGLPFQSTPTYGRPLPSPPTHGAR